MEMGFRCLAKMTKILGYASLAIEMLVYISNQLFGSLNTYALDGCTKMGVAYKIYLFIFTKYEPYHTLCLCKHLNFFFF